MSRGRKGESPLGPPREVRNATSIRFSPELLERIKKAAKKHEHTVTAVIEWCLEEALPKLEKR